MESRILGPLEVRTGGCASRAGRREVEVAAGDASVARVRAGERWALGRGPI